MMQDSKIQSPTSLDQMVRSESRLYAALQHGTHREMLAATHAVEIASQRMAAEKGKGKPSDGFPRDQGVAGGEEVKAATVEGVLMQCGPDMLRTLQRACEMIDESPSTGSQPGGNRGQDQHGASGGAKGTRSREKERAPHP